jgi:hypothetical protein
MTSSALPSLAERFASALDRVVREVGNRFREWSFGPQRGPIPPSLCLVIEGWLDRRRTLVMALIARFQAGKLRRPGPSRPRTRPEGATRPARWPPPPDQSLPRWRNWLQTLVPEVEHSGAWLSDLLTEPEMRALAEAAPQLGRYLRPVLRAVGREVPEWLRAPPRPRPPEPPEDDLSDLRPMDKRYGTPRQWRRRERRLDAEGVAHQTPSIQLDLSR